MFSPKDKEPNMIGVQDADAKKEALQKIIDMMTGHMMSGLKKKGAPAVAAIEIKADKPMEGSPEEEKSESPMEAKAEGDEDPEMLKQLMGMYESKDDEDKDSNC